MFWKTDGYSFNKLMPVSKHAKFQLNIYAKLISIKNMHIAMTWLDSTIRKKYATSGECKIMHLDQKYCSQIL